MKTIQIIKWAIAMIPFTWSAVTHAQISFEEDSAFHFAGYADVGYNIVQGAGDDVFKAGFSPIIHYQYQDWFLFEAEGEFEFEHAGSTEKNSALEYAAMNFFVNDNLTIGVGKFLSPVGNFIQNLHPSWVNKLPTMPLGFMGGHHGAGATPNVDFGIQARGGFETGEKNRMNYAIMAGNGPELIVEEHEDGDLILEGFGLPAKIDDANSNKAVGGRLGFLPVPNFEVGISFETAKAAFAGTKPADDHAAGEDPAVGEEDHSGSLIRDRSYKVFSFDFYFAPTEVKNLILRGEYASTTLGKGRSDEYDRDKKRWETWYTQASYYFPDQKIEAVARYGNFSPAGGSKMKQWSLGLNYLQQSRSILKVAYEFNNGGRADRTLLQYAYGF